MKFNLSTRIIMFSICTSIEYDLKYILLQNSSAISFTNDMLSKAIFRNQKLNKDNKSDVLNQLDLSDYIEIIASNPIGFGINNEKSNILQTYFEKVIPVRNRVMHTKPLELGDRAILSEVIEDIDTRLNWLNWKEVTVTRGILQDDPSKLILNRHDKVIEYRPEVYQNLPEPEFDDTGYIGRSKEIQDIKKLLLNKKNQIITIVGNGGIGKTAIAVKILYDMIDDPQNEYEAVIWISLKTKTLSKGEFVEIGDSIKNIPEMFACSARWTVNEDGLLPRDNLIKFMEEFKVLLVLDNLETINNEDINSFIKDVPDKSKVLITSRHGIGELEYRCNLEGMNIKDSVIYFRELSKYFGLELHRTEDSKIKELIQNHLYSNPLSIKWFMSGIYNGMDENTILSKKDKLVEYCMSNVFNKLSTSSKNILQLFLLENKHLSLGEIDFFVEVDDVSLRKSINELFSMNMLTFRNGNYSINDMARDYLSIYHAPSNEFVIYTSQKRKTLNLILESILVKNENDPFNPRSMFASMRNENHKLASYYLTMSLEKSAEKNWEKAFELTEKAATIAPDYFEVYKIKAFIMAEKLEFYGALSNYQIALGKCESDFEKATVLFLFSIFYVIKLNDNPKALELIEEAERYCPNEVIIKLEKSRILIYLGRFSEAEDILKELRDGINKFGLKIENLYASRYAELHRRVADNFENRDYEQKLNHLKKAVEEIERVSNIDQKTYLTLGAIAFDLSLLFYNHDAMEFLTGVLNKHFSALKSIPSKKIKRMQELLITKQNEIPDNLFASLKLYVHNYRKDADRITETNQGIVTYIKGHYGFIANKSKKDIYFNVSNLVEGIEVGDRVKFSTYFNKNGIAAKDIVKIND